MTITSGDIAGIIIILIAPRRTASIADSIRKKPWALKQLVVGKWAAEIEEKEERKRQLRLKAAAKLLHLYEIVGVPLDRIMAELDRLETEVPTQEGN